jgi:hypothetical protein
MALVANAGTSLSNSFIEMWSDDVKQAYQATSSKLVDSVRVVRNVTGSTYKFHKLTKGGSIKNKARFEDITAMSDTSKSLTSPGAYTGGTAQNSVVSATLNNFHSGEYVDDMDMFKVNIDLRSTFAQSIAAALSRAVDQEIIDALDASTPTNIKTTAQGANGLNKAALLEVHEALNALDVPTNDRTLIVSPAALTDILTDTTLVSSDSGVITNTALATGFVPSIFGFKVISSNLLTSDSVVRKCYAIHKDSVGLALAQDMQARIDYVPQKASHLVLGTMSGGSTVIDADGVVEIQVTE